MTREFHALRVGMPCPNCATPLQGRWCFACGQKDADYHRSIRHLIVEASEGFTHADGRFWQTLRQLTFAPAKLTRAFLEGHRAPQIPPFRMFLVVLLILFVTAPLGNLGNNKWTIQFMDPYSAEARARGLPDIGNGPIALWLKQHMARAAKEPERASAQMEHWAHNAAILTVVVAAPLLALAFARRRDLFFFDHVIFSMHSLAFQGIVLAVAIVVGTWIIGAWLLLLLCPIHLFVHMRGVYRTSVAGTLARMTLLFAGSVIGFGLLFAGLVLIGLAAET